LGRVKQGITAILSVLLTFFGAASKGDSTWVYAVQISATAQSSPPRIVLSWPQDQYGANSYTVYRKTKDSGSWGTGTTLPGSTTSYADNNVAVGGAYEYQIVKQASLGYTGYGYIYAGIESPLVENRGKVILVVDSSQAGGLNSELTRLQQDLFGDGWSVVRRDVSRTDTPANVRTVIRNAYNADPVNVKAVFLFGHVPIFRSGNLNVDGHQPRNMPADGFYGDMDGTWDSPNTIPSDIDLMVGRVDLFNMPVAGRSETELLRNYLNKDHNWRHKRINVPRRALIGDRFGDLFEEVSAANGFRNFEPFVGPGSIARANEQLESAISEKWSSMLTAGTYLWAFGCGGGSYTSMMGMGTHDDYKDVWSSDIIDGDAKAVFFMMFGSWFGEWDSTDNLMRAALATSTMGLTCSWAGRPHWYYHHMGLGEPIGYSARLTQNNSGLYRNQSNPFQRGVHIALMGDPTLRMHPVAPPSNAGATPIAGGHRVTWTASAESDLDYHVYRATNAAGPYSRLTSALVSGTSFNDTTSGSGTYTYMVRAVKLENTPSGTYYNASQGVLTVGTNQAGADLTAPVIAISAPANNAVLSGTNIQVTATATDNVGVAAVQFQLDGNSLGFEDTTVPYNLNFNADGFSNGIHQLRAVARDIAGNRATSAVVSVTISNVTSGNSSNEVIWFDDALPAGAMPMVSGGDSWTWVPTPVCSGGSAHQSTGTGNQQHYFSYASETMTVNTGDVLMTYIYLDPANLPQQVMLQWNKLSPNGSSWEHRAYWGASVNTFGVEGTISRRAMGVLPAAGRWVRLEVPAAAVGLEGSTIKGMAFTLYGGRATWDRVGKIVGASVGGAPVTLSARGSAAGMQITWGSVSGQRYRIQATVNLQTWSEVATVTATGSTTLWTDSALSTAYRFYRVIAE
jgi:hypothetical protein